MFYSRSLDAVFHKWNVLMEVQDKMSRRQITKAKNPAVLAHVTHPPPSHLCLQLDLRADN